MDMSFAFELFNLGNILDSWVLRIKLGFNLSRGFEFLY